MKTVSLITVILISLTSFSQHYVELYDVQKDTYDVTLYVPHFLKKETLEKKEVNQILTLLGAANQYAVGQIPDFDPEFVQIIKKRGEIYLYLSSYGDQDVFLNTTNSTFTIVSNITAKSNQVPLTNYKGGEKFVSLSIDKWLFFNRVNKEEIEYALARLELINQIALDQDIDFEPDFVFITRINKHTELTLISRNKKHVSLNISNLTSTYVKTKHKHRQTIIKYNYSLKYRINYNQNLSNATN